MHDCRPGQALGLGRQMANAKGRIQIPPGLKIDCRPECPWQWAASVALVFLGITDILKATCGAQAAFAMRSIAGLNTRMLTAAAGASGTTCRVGIRNELLDHILERDTRLAVMSQVLPAEVMRYRLLCSHR